ncbi:MAG TPA: hypothetical protein VNY80_07990 [Steroidobacteraceae bacterium]|jgi:hypothetical protein|nr:hypothetical protein [Steroidobacteraceae bacterium]
MDLRAAAEAFCDSYGEHLNHHCARCTAAWEKLRFALEAAPAAQEAAALDTKIEGEFRASMGDRRK